MSIFNHSSKLTMPLLFNMTNRTIATAQNHHLPSHSSNRPTQLLITNNYLPTTTPPLPTILPIRLQTHKFPTFRGIIHMMFSTAGFSTIYIFVLVFALAVDGFCVFGRGRCWFPFCWMYDSLLWCDGYVRVWGLHAKKGRGKSRKEPY
jgi:hypothetical protein